MPNLDPATLQATRERLLKDFAFWAKHSCKIRTKAGAIVPLVLNRVQKRFLALVVRQLQTTGRIRVVVLKGRQQGLSTVISAYIYWFLSQHSARKGIVIAHVKDSTQALFDMYKRAHEHMPALLRPSTRYSSRRELVFDKLDSGLMVATAGGDSIARGETLQCMHLSEVAFWPKTFANANFNGLIQALPDVDETMCFVESTANGVTGQFFDLWRGATEGTNGFETFFSAWYESAEYQETPPATFERTPSEQELVDLYNLNDAQLYWRRRKIAHSGIELFNQEYPCTADEAFITSGRPVFDQHVLLDMLNNAKEPIARMAVEPTAQGHKVVDHPRGELLVYHKREETSNYAIGADVSVGIKSPEKADWCVAQVLDDDMRQVAVWRGQVTPDEYARVLFALGMYYNNALIAPERNGHGLLVCVRLWTDLSYPNVFMDLKEGEIAERETLNLGFQTNVSSRPLIIDKLRGFIRDRDIEINDRTTLSELQTFVCTDTGKMEAEQGTFDDCVLALAIAAHVHPGKWSPIDVTDDFYAEAI
jgi:hypothetical protein